jgi:hypothetical protein
MVIDSSLLDVGEHGTMTSCSLRRLQELAISATMCRHPCNASDEGVGTREQLVRVPIKRGEDA